MALAAQERTSPSRFLPTRIACLLRPCTLLVQSCRGAADRGADNGRCLSVCSTGAKYHLLVLTVFSQYNSCRELSHNDTAMERLQITNGEKDTERLASWRGSRPPEERDLDERQTLVCTRQRVVSYLPLRVRWSIKLGP